MATHFMLHIRKNVFNRTKLIQHKVRKDKHINLHMVLRMHSLLKNLHCYSVLMVHCYKSGLFEVYTYIYV